MASFSKDPVIREPFGKNEYRHSTKGLKFGSFTVAKDSVQAEDIDGTSQKVLQSGEVMAKILTGKDAGKIGPFQAEGVDEVNTLERTGTVSGGTYIISHPAFTGATTPIAHNANASAIQAAVTAWLGAQDGELLVAGGPVSTDPVTFTWVDEFGANRAMLAVASSVTGGGSIAFTETLAGASGATDGRGATANIVGVQDTFLPWELNDRDHNSSVCYEGFLKQGWCYERNAAGERIPLTDVTRNAILANPALRLGFK